MHDSYESGRRVTRRGLLGIGVGALAGLAASRLRSRQARAMDNCYWKTVQSATCYNGQLREYRCEICCAGGVCETVQCAWFVVGSC